MMEPEEFENAPLENSKNRNLPTMPLYILIGLSGIGLAAVLRANPIFETVFLLLAGFGIGSLTQKLVKQRRQQNRHPKIKE